MNRQELAEEIVRLNTEEKFSLTFLQDENIFEEEKFEHLRKAFKKKGNKVGKEKWHQFVRFVLTPKNEWEYMYERLARLLNNHNNGFGDYFAIDSKNQMMPDRTSDLIRFHRIYKRFFLIYMKIIKKMHVDYPQIIKNEQKITGKIDWKQTLLKNKTEFPINFETRSWNRNFATPENVLFFLCIRWLNKEVKKILNVRYTEPLEADEIHILNEVEFKTTKLLQNFPHNEIVNKSKKFFKFSPDDITITHVIQKVKERISQGEIKNHAYIELIDWLLEFRQLGLQNWSGNMSKYHINALEDLDTMYEAWIFLEMIDFLKIKKNLDTKVVFRKSSEDESFVEFGILGHKICIYYEKHFEVDRREAWIFKHRPDFSIFIDNNLVGILDAKNYKKSSAERRTATEKMMAYLVNFDTNYGALIFPNFETEVFQKNGKFHKNQVLSHFRMKPIESMEEINKKYDSLEKIFEKILSSIEQEIKI